MPIRFLRPNIRTSERWHRARYFDRCFWISLLSLVDDYGRYEGNTTLLASECFPYGDENGLPVTPSAIDGVLRSLAGKGLLTVYKKGNKQFVAMTRWIERKRSESKYPDPDNDKECEIVWKSEDCEPMLSFDNKRTQMNAPSPSPSPSPSPCTGRFAPPTLEEVHLQGARIGLPAVQCEMFMAHYESNGWKVGRNGMKSWQSAMTKWKLTWQQGNNGKSSGITGRSSQENPRNAGICKGPEDYGAIARLKEARDSAELAEKVAARQRESSEAQRP